MEAHDHHQFHSPDPPKAITSLTSHYEETDLVWKEEGIKGLREGDWVSKKEDLGLTRGV